MGEERLCARLLAGIQTLFLVLPLPNSVTFDKSSHLSESLSSPAQLFSSFASDSLCFSCKRVRLWAQRRNKFDAEFLPLIWPWVPLITCKQHNEPYTSIIQPILFYAFFQSLALLPENFLKQISDFIVLHTHFRIQYLDKNYFSNITTVPLKLL